MSTRSAVRASWSDRDAYLPIRKVAALFGRSPEWVRDAIEDGTLFAVRSRPGGPRLICVESVLALRERMRRGASASVRPASGGAPRLRLVWVNPAMS